MKILGNRVLLSKIEEEKTEGFQAVSVQDSFVNKGKVEQLAWAQEQNNAIATLHTGEPSALVVGATVLFAKYSPDTQEIDVEGKKMKVVQVSDIIAIL